MLTRRRLIQAGAGIIGTKSLTPDCFAQQDTTLPNDSRRWDVRRFGAKGDGVALDTRAVQDAIEACANAGGGEVYFATGFTFLIGTIYLRSHIGLHIEANSTILGSNRLSDYGNDVGLSPFYPLETIDPCLIYAKDCTDLRIGGPGTIIGFSGNRFIAPAGADERASRQRPMLFRFDSCAQASATDVSLKHCGSWCMHFRNSHDIFLRNVRIDNDRQDGFDLEGCENVSVSDCHLVCGDDAIAITTSSKEHPARNITITNCVLRSRWAAIRFGPLSRGDFENIVVSNCVFYDCNGGGIKLGVYEGATIRNCLFSNLIMDQVVAPITLFVATWPMIGSSDPNPPLMPAGSIRDLQFRGIQAVTKPGPPQPRPDSNGGLFFQGHPNGLIRNILLEDVVVTLDGGGTSDQAARRNIVDMDQIDYRKDGYWTDHKSTWGVPPAFGLYARHIDGLTLRNVTFRLNNPDKRSAVFCSDSSGIRITGLVTDSSPVDTSVVVARNCVGVRLSEIEPQPKAAVLLRLEGETSDRVVLSDNDPEAFTRLYVCTDGAPERTVHKIG